MSGTEMYIPTPTPDLTLPISKASGVHPLIVTKVLAATRRMLESAEHAYATDLRGYLLAAPVVPKHYTVDQVAARLGISRSWLWRSCRSGAIPHSRIGQGRGTLRFSEEHIAAINDLIERGAGRYHSPKVTRGPRLATARRLTGEPAARQA